ncbi:glycosyltransferase [Mucilaginibacter sp. RS28]|uniref:Glycosyltransferase n=1 Tax=Mucilaginibacter straminoryzae TaxID=2932774 RepID=A0A9X2B9V7_9SPHI|nr:glycosyltransferase [Mucilaginibacter straminoryzae]MCJ8211094.1 glycosyltransferase [Mucilaginibacter straminoryzae]
MKLSVVIVSHNQCGQLRKSLSALTRAVKNLDAEIILIDNSSEDNTSAMALKEFPEVRLMTLSPFRRYTQAGNQGLSMVKGEFVLLLNPDVVVKPKSIEQALAFMTDRQSAGGLNIRMVDEAGNYLQESKKVLPRTWVAFLKLTGLFRQFQKSRFTDYLSASYKDEFDIAETDVLNNCFMLTRYAVLQQIGLFDERFSDYGATIDFSYRMRLVGFKNYYFPKTYLIQMADKRVSRFNWQHLKNFYLAMFIFAAKYLFSLPALHVKPVQKLYPAYELKG